MLWSGLVFSLFISLGECSNSEWDLLIFTQHWPNTVCLQYEESGPSHVCALPKKSSRWTIHGVWPTKFHTEGPAFCNKTMKFDPVLLKPIRDDLLVWWPNLEGGQGVASLWMHEWLKHGTCAVILPTLNSEEKYFGQGLQWMQQYDMTEILSSGGIFPSDDHDYNLATIHQIILSRLNVRPHIACVKEKYSKKAYLFELRICFDKTFRLVDCDGTVIDDTEILGNCPSDVGIRYPKTLPPLFSPPIQINKSTGRIFRTIMHVLAFLDWIV